MDFKEVIEALEVLKEEVGIPKNLKLKIDNIIKILNNKDESEEVRCHKAEAILEEASNNTSLQPFIRTQIYQIISLL